MIKCSRLRVTCKFKNITGGETSRFLISGFNQIQVRHSFRSQLIFLNNLVTKVFFLNGTSVFHAFAIAQHDTDIAAQDT